MTTYYLDEAEGADTVCMIDGGKLVFTGSPGEMKTRLHSSTLEEAYISLLTGEAA